MVRRTSGRQQTNLQPVSRDGRAQVHRDKTCRGHAMGSCAPGRIHAAYFEALERFLGWFGAALRAGIRSVAPLDGCARINSCPARLTVCGGSAFQGWTDCPDPADLSAAVLRRLHKPAIPARDRTTPGNSHQLFRGGVGGGVSRRWVEEVRSQVCRGLTGRTSRFGCTVGGLTIGRRQNQSEAGSRSRSAGIFERDDSTQVFCQSSRNPETYSCTEVFLRCEERLE